MKGDMPPAALRLSQSLTVRTVAKRSEYAKPASHDLSRFIAAGAEARRRRVVIRGKVYASLRAAAAEIGVHKDTIGAWIVRGRARYE